MPKPLYSKKFRATYGERLRRDEIQLLQAYRGLSAETRATVRGLLADIIISESRRAEWTRAGARARLVAHELTGGAR